MLLAYLFSRIALHLAQHGAHPPQEYFAKTQHPLRGRPHHLRHCCRTRKPRRGGDKIKRRPHSLCLLKKTRGKVSYMKEIRNFASHCRRFPDVNRLFADNATDRQHSINNLKKTKRQWLTLSATTASHAVPASTNVPPAQSPKAKSIQSTPTCA